MKLFLYLLKDCGLNKLFFFIFSRDHIFQLYACATYVNILRNLLIKLPTPWYLPQTVLEINLHGNAIILVKLFKIINISFMFQESSSARRGCTRRWTSLKQNPRSELLSETGTSTSLSTPSSTANTSPALHPGGGGGVGGGGIENVRKSNWQVIEHFGSKDKGSLSSSLIAVSNILLYVIIS